MLVLGGLVGELDVLDDGFDFLVDTFCILNDEFDGLVRNSVVSEPMLSESRSCSYSSASSIGLVS